jgi:predicted RNA binding protein YcfA (HicA-like mRNA interferase family)
VTSRELLKLLRRAGCTQVRQTGSHLIVRCGSCQTVVAMHPGDISNGTLRAIEKQLEPCLGEGWMQR